MPLQYIIYISWDWQKKIMDRIFFLETKTLLSILSGENGFTFKQAVSLKYFRSTQSTQNLANFIFCKKKKIFFFIFFLTWGKPKMLCKPEVWKWLTVLVNRKIVIWQNDQCFFSFISGMSLFFISIKSC